MLKKRLSLGGVASLVLAVAAPPAFAQSPAPYQTLVSVESTTEPLRDVPVMDAMGNVVGNFRHLTTQDRVPESIIELNNQKTVAVPDRDLGYDPLSNTVVSGLTKDQLDSMPARF
jgi:hypothetical protein